MSDPRTLEGSQNRLLDVFEHGQGTPAGGAVEAGSSHLEAPANSLALHVVGIDPGFAAEGVLERLLHLAVDAGHGRIDHEAPVAGVLDKGAPEGRAVTIRLRDGRLEVVEHDAHWGAAEERPCVLQALDQVRKRLAVGDVDVLVAAVDQGQDQRVEDPKVSGRGIAHEAEAAEVHLGPPPRGRRTVARPGSGVGSRS